MKVSESDRLKSHPIERTYLTKLNIWKNAERFISGKYCSVCIMKKLWGRRYFLTDYYTDYMPLKLEVA